MSSDLNPILVTCGLPYANGPCHIGHLRTYIPADFYVRFLRKLGRRVVFICGSDSHGTPILLSAEAQGISPQELVETYHNHFIKIFRELGVEFDYYGNTHDPLNQKLTQDLISKLIQSGYIYPRKLELPYCPKCSRSLPDRYIQGRCPKCGALARGDECDQGCGKHLEPGEILEPRCKLCGSPTISRSEEHYFFKLSEFRDFLEGFLDELKGTPNIKYARSFLPELRDWCITRNLEWGVRFPGTQLVVYVWVDAPMGYISFTIQAIRDWEGFWRGNWPIVHFIGEDILYHHCIFWPALLKAGGYSVPSAIVASGMVKIQGRKFSKTRGWVVWVDQDLLQNGIQPDAIRYYLLSYTSHTKDLDFSWEIFQAKINDELVGILGNFIHRVLSFAYSRYGEVPEGELDPQILERISDAISRSKQLLEEYEFKQILDELMELAGFGNEYFQEAQPWKLIQEDPQRCKNVIRSCLQLAKALCILFEPALPFSMQQCWRFLGCDSQLSYVGIQEALEPIHPGRIISKPWPLFQKLPDSKLALLKQILESRIREIS